MTKPRTPAEAVANLRHAIASLLRSVAIAVDVAVEPIPSDWAEAAGEGVLCFGVVQDAGGGMVDIWVERDTETYPEVGRRVALWPAGPR